MTREELDKHIRVLQNQFEEEKKRLIILYIKQNNPYVIGDIVKDHKDILKIESIQYSLYGPICAVYTGIELKADLTPKKKQTGAVVYQSNLRDEEGKRMYP